MLDIKFIRENPDAVKENIKKKFQRSSSWTASAGPTFRRQTSSVPTATA